MSNYDWSKITPDSFFCKSEEDLEKIWRDRGLYPPPKGSMAETLYKDCRENRIIGKSITIEEYEEMLQ